MGLISHVKKKFPLGKGRRLGGAKYFFCRTKKKVGNQGVSQCCGAAVRPSAGCEEREKFFSLFPVFLGALLWETDLAERVVGAKSLPFFPCPSFFTLLTFFSLFSGKCFPR